MHYCAIIGDIVGSKKLKDRQALQDRFISVLGNMNQKYDAYIASNFTMTLGDEFQGLLHVPSMCMDMVRDLKEHLQPVQLVFGIGIGEMLTHFAKDSSVGSDGPAYWHARKMVEQAKQKSPSIRIFSDSPEDELINSLLRFVEVSTQSRTNRQQEITNLYQKLGSQQKVAETLGIHQSAVSVALKNACYREIESSFEQIRQYLKMKWEA